MLPKQSVAAVALAATALATPIFPSSPAQAAITPHVVAAPLSVHSVGRNPGVAVHTTIAGDTLWRIAASHCGRGQLYVRLAAGNGIANPHLIRVGQRIRLTCATRVPTRAAPARPSVATATGSRIDRAIAYALAQVGKPYRWGAAGPAAFDCSGLVMAAFARVGVRLPHQSGAMLSYGTRVSRAQLRRGDIVWPHSGHVGIYLGGGKMVHASNPRTDIYVSTVYSFWTARRVIR